MQINRENVKWAGRMTFILLIVAASDELVVLFVRKPFPWVVWSPALVPVLTAVFVILPMLRAEKTKASKP